jgi:hypothetical protein
VCPDVLKDVRWLTVVLRLRVALHTQLLSDSRSLFVRARTRCVEPRGIGGRGSNPCPRLAAAGSRARADRQPHGKERGRGYAQQGEDARRNPPTPPRRRSRTPSTLVLHRFEVCAPYRRGSSWPSLGPRRQQRSLSGPQARSADRRSRRRAKGEGRRGNDTTSSKRQSGLGQPQSTQDLRNLSRGRTVPPTRGHLAPRSLPTAITSILVEQSER